MADDQNRLSLMALSLATVLTVVLIAFGVYNLGRQLPPPVEGPVGPATAAAPGAAAPAAPGVLAPAAPAGINTDDPGYKLMTKSDCFACHRVEKSMAGPAIGPTYVDVANKYQASDSTIAALTAKVKAGGTGVWGALPMTPHPTLSEADITQMVKWVLSLRGFKPAAGAAAAPVDLAALVEEVPLIAYYVRAPLEQPQPDASYWRPVAAIPVTLTAQPLTVPRPKTTLTAKVMVQAVHNGERMSVRLRWADSEESVAGRLATFSDAVALMFPVEAGEVPPPISMGADAQPVHIYQWRTDYQVDKEVGRRTPKDLYPNMAVDIYPLEFQFDGGLPHITAQERETFAAGQAAGNPQAFRKGRGVDEVVAQGFGTSALIEIANSQATGVWRDGEWTVVITRALISPSASRLTLKRKSFTAFAVWQGGAQEVGARKCVTMKWTPLQLAPSADILGAAK